jgi:hypothetical protein
VLSPKNDDIYHDFQNHILTKGQFNFQSYSDTKFKRAHNQTLLYIEQGNNLEVQEFTVLMKNELEKFMLHRKSQSLFM